MQADERVERSGLNRRVKVSQLRAGDELQIRGDEKRDGNAGRNLMARRRGTPPRQDGDRHGHGEEQRPRAGVDFRDRFVVEEHAGATQPTLHKHERDRGHHEPPHRRMR